jgi:hypothetical protein
MYMYIKEHRERADHSSVEKAKHRQDMTSSRVTGSSNNIWFLTLSKEAYFNKQQAVDSLQYTELISENFSLTSTSS